MKSAAKNLGMYQSERMEQMPHVGAKVADIIVSLLQCAGGDVKFQIIVDDPAGNSFIQNPVAPQNDPNMKVCTRSVVSAFLAYISVKLS